MARRVLPALTALLVAASLTAGLSAWKRARSPQAPAAGAALLAAPTPPPSPAPEPPDATGATGTTAPASVTIAATDAAGAGATNTASLLPAPASPPPIAPSALPIPAPLKPPSPGNASSDPGGPLAAMFRGDPGRRHRSALKGPAAPRLLFATPTGGPIAAMPASLPGGDVLVASLSGKVLRLSSTGAVVWTADLGDRVYASPLVTGDLVVVGSDADRVTALSTKTGKPRWSLRVDGDADTSAAMGAGGSIILAAGRIVYALRPNGAVLWRFTAKKKVYASPAVAPDGTIYIGSQDDRLYALSPHGALLWQRDLGADIDCAAAVGDAGLVYVGTDGGAVIALDALGTPRWRASIGGFVRGGLTITRDGTVLAGTYGPGPRVVALDGATGAERWSFPIQGTGAPEFGIHGAPLEDADGNLYFGAPDNRVYALDAAGHLRFTFDTGDDVDAPLTLGPGGVLYAGSYDGQLYALH